MVQVTKSYNKKVFGKIKKNVLFAGALTGNYRLLLPMFRPFKKRYPRLTNSNTALCIEGYPRSGNSYFVSAFLMWNQGISVAHHSHLAGSVKQALVQGVPTVLLVRNPRDCVSSTLAWDGLLLSSIALAGFTHFYRQLWSYRQQFLVMRFEDVIQRPDECIQIINRRFGKTFATARFNSSVDQEIRSRLEKVDARHARRELNSTLPNSTKIELKLKYAKLLASSRLYKNAQLIYEDYRLLTIRPDRSVTQKLTAHSDSQL